MKRLTHCCFGLSLKTGCTIIAIWSMVSIIFSYLSFAFERRSIAANTVVEEYHHRRLYSVTLLTDLIIFLPANIFLLQGTRLGRASFLMIWISTYTILIFMYLTVAFYGLYTVIAHENTAFPFLGTTLISIPLVLYSILVVYSHYLELKEPRLNNRTSIIPAVRVPTIYENGGDPSLSVFRTVVALPPQPLPSMPSPTTVIPNDINIQPPPYNELFSDKPTTPPPPYSETDQSTIHVRSLNQPQTN